ncbi:MAG: hypothetical protein H6621_04995 [Halobacteriovoraceae bacterium]|nr:hypothetical protein [Halobacteriovoraceae bacterium]
MLGKLFNIFKKKNKPSGSNSEEYLDFSDFTDVQIAGTQRFDKKKVLKEKPAQKISEMAQPQTARSQSSLQTEPHISAASDSDEMPEFDTSKTVIPPINTEILKQLNTKDDTYEEDTGEAQIPTGLNLEVTTPGLDQLDAMKKLQKDREKTEEMRLTEVDMSFGKKLKTSLFSKGGGQTAPHEKMAKKSIGTVFKNLFKKGHDISVGDLPIEHGVDPKDYSGDKTIFGKHETVKFKIKPEKNANLTRLAIILIIAIAGTAVLFTFSPTEDESASNTPAAKIKPKFKKGSGKVETKDEKKVSDQVKEEKKAIESQAQEKKKEDFDEQTVQKAAPTPALTPEPQPQPQKPVAPKVAAPSPVPETVKPVDDGAISVDDFPEVEPAPQKKLPPARLKSSPPAQASPKVNRLSEGDLIEIENDFSSEQDEDSIKSLTDLDVNYLAAGSNLVYNCSGRHWACVTKINYLKCKKLAGFNPKRCFPVNQFNTKRACQLQQIQNINNNASTSFCY